MARRRPISSCLGLKGPFSCLAGRQFRRVTTVRLPRLRHSLADRRRAIPSVESRATTEAGNDLEAKGVYKSWSHSGYDAKRADLTLSHISTPRQRPRFD